MNEPDPLARALLPVLLHKLANTTQLLTGLDAMLRIEGGEEMFLKRCPDLARASEDVEDLGWALAVLGSAGGADVLLARREPRGLEILFDLVRSAARRGQRDLAPPPWPDGEWPGLAPHVLGGWELPWAVAALLHASGLDAGPGGVGDWDLASAVDRWVLTVPAGPEVESALERSLPRLEGASCEREGERACLALPADWLTPPSTG